MSAQIACRSKTSLQETLHARCATGNLRRVHVNVVDYSKQVGTDEVGVKGVEFFQGKEN